MSIAARRQELFALHRPIAQAIFAADGTVRPGVDARTAGDANDPRARIWHTFALFHGAGDWV